jgi:hypothetical protein
MENTPVTAPGKTDEKRPAIGKTERLCAILVAAFLGGILFKHHLDYYYGEFYCTYGRALLRALFILVFPGIIIFVWPRISRIRFYGVVLLAIFSSISAASFLLSICLAIFPIEAIIKGFIKNLRTREISTGGKIGVAIGQVLFVTIAVALMTALCMGALLVDGMNWNITGVGRRYMTTLTPAKISEWEERTREYLKGISEDKYYENWGTEVPPDLRAIGILRIEIRQDEVSYVWAGGLDHVNLTVKRMEDGSFEFVGQYGDHSWWKLWPKDSRNPAFTR